MTLKIYNGSSWQTLKSLKIVPPGPGPWTVAKKGWIYNGSAWSIFYPEFPSSSSNPTISVTSGTNGRIGCQYTANAGTWNADDAYVPTSYAYQWTRSSLDISGATNQSYVTTASDADKIIGVKVTATNNRGSTTSTSNTGTPMLPVVSNFTATDSTQSVSAPTVTFNVSNLSFSGSWTAVSNATTYETTYGGTASSTSVDISNRTFGGNGSAGSASFSVRAVNTNRVVSLSWAAAPGASSYDIYIGGSLHTNITSTSYTYNPPDDNSRTYTIYPRTSTTQGYGSSQISLAAPTKYSSYGTGSGTLVQPNATSPTSASSSISTSSLFVDWSGATNATKYRVYWVSNANFAGDPTQYYDTETTSTSAYFNATFTSGTTYYVYISASGNNNVWTPYGSYKTSATPAYPAPGTPSPSTSSATATSFSISWSATSNTDSYRVWVGTSSGGNNIVNTSTSSTSYSVTGLSSSTTYYVTITGYGNGYGGYGSNGTTSATTTASPPVIGTPTRPTFYRSGTTIKWGFDNPSFSGAFTPFGVEWEVGNSSSGPANITSGNTKDYNTNWISTSGLPSIWHYIVGSHAGDLPATSSARYLRFRLYGQNTVTYAIVDGPWSPWSV